MRKKAALLLAAHDGASETFPYQISEYVHIIFRRTIAFFRKIGYNIPMRFIF